jgi:hypothetical protein
VKRAEIHQPDEFFFPQQDHPTFTIWGLAMRSSWPFLGPFGQGICIDGTRLQTTGDASPEVFNHKNTRNIYILSMNIMNIRNIPLNIYPRI